mmetsp:Transcript_125341/g.217315  ORF Transcript_125341/g.217315 Transcript_125341/m.217315 type:complete len:83 (-) Transcript_125341:155-403(-)
MPNANWIVTPHGGAPPPSPGFLDRACMLVAGLLWCDTPILPQAALHHSQPGSKRTIITVALHSVPWWCSGSSAAGQGNTGSY